MGVFVTSSSFGEPGPAAPSAAGGTAGPPTPPRVRGGMRDLRLGILGLRAWVRRRRFTLAGKHSLHGVSYTVFEPSEADD